MIKKLYIVCLLAIGTNAFAQNAGQPSAKGLNYTDINGMKQGPWVKKTDDGALLYEGFFKDNLPVGVFKRYHSNGKLKSEMVFDVIRPKYASVKMWDITGELSATGFYDDKAKDSVWEYYTIKEKMVYHEEYKKGLRHGSARKYYSSGNLAEEKMWKQGMMHGKWVQYYPDGTVRLKADNKDDKRTGAFLVNHANGKPLVTGQYANDLQEGLWKVLLEDGKLDKELKYKNGKIENEQELDKKLAKEIEAAEKMQGQFDDPENFLSNPEEFFNK